MPDDTWSLPDVLLDLFTAWQLIQEEYRRHFGDLLAGALAASSPGPGRQLIFDLVLHQLASEQLARCLEDLGRVLDEVEEHRQTYKG